jgi:hypothetical protein
VSERVRSPGPIRDQFREVGYLADDMIADALFFADGLRKPLLIEGPAGVGKTELAKATATLTGARLIRLQCYEGLDEAKALYECNWTIPTQTGNGRSSNCESLASCPLSPGRRPGSSMPCAHSTCTNPEHLGIRGLGSQPRAARCG